MVSSAPPNWDTSSLRPVQNVAGHDGAFSDPDGEIFVKPCTQAEIDFYHSTLASHPDFAQLMPTFMGTLALGAPTQLQGHTDTSDGPTAADPPPTTAATGAATPSKPRSGPIQTNTAIVLNNLEHSFRRPNVLDLKLGARLYAPGTAAEKASRLDKVAAETISGSLHFRVAGMKVWNPRTAAYDVYDKQYGRRFRGATDVADAFAAFFAPLLHPAALVRPAHAEHLLETLLADVTKARHCLERAESRFYSSSLLLVFEGDAAALQDLMGDEPKTPRAQERAPTVGEVRKSEVDEEAEDDDDDDDDDDEPEAFKVRMIDFAHSAWCPGEGKDENVIVGLKNVEKQLDALIARFTSQTNG